jgi:hypothetical protein
VITLVLTIGFHYKEFLEYPIQHLQNFPNSAAYGLGIFHPLVFATVVYVIFLIPRGIYKLFKMK